MTLSLQYQSFDTNDLQINLAEETFAFETTEESFIIILGDSEGFGIVFVELIFDSQNPFPVEVVGDTSFLDLDATVAIASFRHLPDGGEITTIYNIGEGSAGTVGEYLAIQDGGLVAESNLAANFNSGKFIARDPLVIGSDLSDHITNTSTFSGEVSTLRGGLGDDTLRGTTSAVDLRGGAGDDLLEGGNSNDRLEGGDDNDLLLGGLNQDRLDGGDGADTLFGGSGQDTLTSAADTIGSTDELFGGEGDDLIIVNSGMAEVNGDAGQDTVSLSGGGVLDLSMSDAQAFNDSTQVLLRSIEHFVGSRDADTVFGDHRNNRIDGVEGSDFLFGRSGDDRLTGSGVAELYGGEGDDTLIGSGHSSSLYLTAEGGQGNDLIKVVDSYVNAVGGFGVDTIDFTDASHSEVRVNLKLGQANPRSDNKILAKIQGIENVTGSRGYDHITGDDGGNALLGGGAGDSIFGGLGNDTLRGGDGSDILNGGKGADSLFGGTESDKLEGGFGADAVFGGADSDKIFGGASNDKLFGGGHNDRINGGVGADRIFGGTGNDTLQGQSGRDLLRADVGNDKVFGGAGFDVMIGGAGNDRLDGGLGNDTIIAGNGRDTIIGGAGADQFFFDRNDNQSIIIDFDDGIDKIGLPDGITFNSLRITERGPDTYISFGKTTIRLFDSKDVTVDRQDFVLSSSAASKPSPGGGNAAAAKDAALFTTWDDEGLF